MIKLLVTQRLNHLLEASIHELRINDANEILLSSIDVLASCVAVEVGSEVEHCG